MLTLLIILKKFITQKVEIIDKNNKQLQLNTSQRFIFGDQKEKNVEILKKNIRFHIFVDGIKMCSRLFDNSVGNCKVGKQKTSEWLFDKYFDFYRIINKPRHGGKVLCLTNMGSYLVMRECNEKNNQLFRIIPDIFEEENKDDQSEKKDDQLEKGSSEDEKVLPRDKPIGQSYPEDKSRGKNHPGRGYLGEKLEKEQKPGKKPLDGRRPEKKPSPRNKKTGQEFPGLKPTGENDPDKQILPGQGPTSQKEPKAKKQNALQPTTDKEPNVEKPSSKDNLKDPLPIHSKEQNYSTKSKNLPIKLPKQENPRSNKPNLIRKNESPTKKPKHPFYNQIPQNPHKEQEKKLKDKSEPFDQKKKRYSDYDYEYEEPIGGEPESDKEDLEDDSQVMDDPFENPNLKSNEPEREEESEMEDEPEMKEEPQRKKKQPKEKEKQPQEKEKPESNQMYIDEPTTKGNIPSNKDVYDHPHKIHHPTTKPKKEEQLSKPYEDSKEDEKYPKPYERPKEDKKHPKPSEKPKEEPKDKTLDDLKKLLDDYCKNKNK